jgi:nitroimidazol reductase NimA-like FMN-containing flavoprotein (pyridoxamine 5'-phosphate oxidase superfamily)
VRTRLRPEDLGDLLSLGLNAVLALHREDGRVMLRPVWHEWADGGFTVFMPPGDRKPAMLRRDRRVTLLVAESAYPYRSIEVRGVAAEAAEPYAIGARRIAARYVDERLIGAYIGEPETGTLIRVEPEVVNAWDYADDDFASPS